MHTDHRLEAATPETLIVMRVDRARHWELGCYDATKNDLGFDPNQHAAEVAMWMDPFSESKIKRINGMIALDSMRAPTPKDSMFDETGRKRRTEGSTRTAGGNRPSSSTRRRRRAAETATQSVPQLIEPAPVAPAPINVAPQPVASVPHPADEMPQPLVPVDATTEMSRDEIDAFAARWNRVNQAADEREAANKDADRTFILPKVPSVGEVPSRPLIGRASVSSEALDKDSTTEHHRVPFAERGALYGKAQK